MAVTRGADLLGGGLLELAPLDLLGERLLERRPPWRRRVACWRERRTTSTPALAATSAMPDPMIPDPTMPSVLIVMGGDATDG